MNKKSGYIKEPESDRDYDYSRFKYGIIAYKPSGDPEYPILVIHFCGYEHPPIPRDFQALKDELNSDTDFGLVGQVGKTVHLMRASPEQVEFYVGALDNKSDE